MQQDRFPTKETDPTVIETTINKKAVTARSLLRITCCSFFINELEIEAKNNPIKNGRMISPINKKEN
jgi:C4-type Zn-finger protein